MTSCLFLSCVALACSAPLVGYVEFDGTSLPEQSGWGRETFGTTNRTLADGLFIQNFDSPGDAEYYRRPISEFAGASTFFAEWRMGTNAPASLLDSFQTPSAFVLYGNGVSYHFRFTDEIALFTRFGNTVAYFGIAPDQMHTYRIELLEDETYRFLIDGTVVESGIQPGPYPTPASGIVWSGEYDQPGHTDQWDYIRYGMIPEPGSAILLLVGAGALMVRRKSRARKT